MVSITPCQRIVSDRFPVASFVVQVPPDRLFEIACATDPSLFHADQRRHRTADNFFSTRAGGLLRAPAGQATYLLPPDQLRRFAGKRRLFYAVGSYSGPRGEDPSFTTLPDAPHTAPSIQISPDFTGRTLDRSRLGRPVAGARYGSPEGVLTWGGDLLARPEETALPAGAPPAYDDGYPPELWARREAPPPAAFGGAIADAAIDEPPGYEDAPAMAEAPAPSAQPAAYGQSPRPSPSAPHHECYPSPQEHTPPGPRPGVPRPAFGGVNAQPVEPAEPELPSLHDDAYQETEPQEPELPEDLPDAIVRGLAAKRPLTIPEKFKIVMIVSSFESGSELYSAINADGEYNDPKHPAYHRYHIGLSWGIVQFTQRGGALGQVLDACRRRDEVRFREVFGGAAGELLAVTRAPTEDERVRAVDGRFLWEAPWIARFRAAGRVPAFPAAQNEVAIEGYLDPNLQFAGWLGLDTDRALAMLYDRCVHMGNGGGRSFVARAAGPIRTQRQRAAALAALGEADLRSFQQATPGLAADGAWGAMTHAAMCAALRELGARSPIAVPGLDEMLDRLVDASKGRDFEARVRALRSSADLRDIAYQVL
jgi:hypothetical protein